MYGTFITCQAWFNFMYINSVNAHNSVLGRWYYYTHFQDEEAQEVW